MARRLVERTLPLSHKASGEAALRDGLLVDLSALKDRDDPACREDQHAAADRRELLIIRTGANDRRAG
jgi:hypothetical protein